MKPQRPDRDEVTIMNIKETVPMKLTNERVWRTYLGGKMLDELHGISDSEDGHFPEEWIGSLISARNAGREWKQDEGLCRLAADPHIYLKEIIEAAPETYLGRAHVDSVGTSAGVLVKLIDSSERLAIQVHPDREQALKLFHSIYGKTECWHILGGREIDGIQPYIYLGFREGVTEERWKALFETQDIQGMLDCLHRYQVKTGDTFLIEGGVPHAIGAGCFLIEIQEPTDYTIRVEKTTPSGLALEDFACHQGIGFDKMFKCFHYEPLSREENSRRRFIPSCVIKHNDTSCKTSIVAYHHTALFKMNMLETTSQMELCDNKYFSMIYIMAGRGTLAADGIVMEIEAGEQYFLPANQGDMEFHCNAEEKNQLRILQCFGPETLG